MKYFTFIIVLFIFSCTSDEETLPMVEETPSLISFLGDYNNVIFRSWFDSLGGGGDDEIIENISLSQTNDSIYNYNISNTQVNHDIIYDGKVDDYYTYVSVNCNSTCTYIEHYALKDSIFIFTRYGGLGQWTEYKTSIKL